MRIWDDQRVRLTTARHLLASCLENIEAIYLTPRPYPLYEKEKRKEICDFNYVGSVPLL
jgi:hypothetical protein